MQVMGRVTQSADWLVEGLAGRLGFFSAPVLDFSLLSSPDANLSVADCHTKAHRHFTLLSMKRVGSVCSAQSVTTRWMVEPPGSAPTSQNSREWVKILVMSWCW